MCFRNKRIRTCIGHSFVSVEEAGFPFCPEDIHPLSQRQPTRIFRQRVSPQQRFKSASVFGKQTETPDFCKALYEKTILAWTPLIVFGNLSTVLTTGGPDYCAWIAHCILKFHTLFGLSYYTLECNIFNGKKSFNHFVMGGVVNGKRIVNYTSEIWSPDGNRIITLLTEIGK